jgi:phage gpG-like protein
MTATQFAAQLQTLARRFPDAAVRAAGEIAVIASSAVKKGLTDGVSPDGTPFRPLGRPRPRGGNKPLLDTGVLRASISAEADGTGLILRANAPGAALHQSGGTIVPVRAKALAIPISRDAARVGSPRNFPRKLFVPKGTRVLAESTGKGKLLVHYALAQSVTIPARPYLGISTATAERLAAAIARRLALALTESAS